MTSSKFAIGLSILVLLAILPCTAQNKALAGIHREFTAAKTSVLKAANKAPEDIGFARRKSSRFAACFFIS